MWRHSILFVVLLSLIWVIDLRTIKRGIGSRSLDPLWCLAQNLWKMQEKSLYDPNDYLATVDVVLRAAGDIFRTKELALLAPQVMLPLCSKSDCWTRVIRPLAAFDVQFGHFPSGKAAAINNHPLQHCSLAAPLEISEKIDLSNPSPSDLSLRSTERKIKSPNLDRGLASQ